MGLGCGRGRGHRDVIHAFLAVQPCCGAAVSRLQTPGARLALRWAFGQLPSIPPMPSLTSRRVLVDAGGHAYERVVNGVSPVPQPLSPLRDTAHRGARLIQCAEHGLCIASAHVAENKVLTVVVR